eukprot:3821308-Alexandrium_andersonii.AAC.1
MKCDPRIRGVPRGLGRSTLPRGLGRRWRTLCRSDPYFPEAPAAPGRGKLDSAMLASSSPEGRNSALE